MNNNEQPQRQRRASDVYVPISLVFTCVVTIGSVSSMIFNGVNTIINSQKSSENRLTNIEAKVKLLEEQHNIILRDREDRMRHK